MPALNRVQLIGNLGKDPETRYTTSGKQVTSLPPVFYIDFPQDLIDEVNKCEDRDAVKQVGVEWAVQQCKELIDYGVPCLHFYTMGDWRTTRAIVEQIV